MSLIKFEHFVSHAGDTWEVDVYEGLLEGVVLAEIELADAGVPDYGNASGIIPTNVNLIVERTPASAFEPIVLQNSLLRCETRNYRIQMNGVFESTLRASCSSLNQYCSFWS